MGVALHGSGGKPTVPRRKFHLSVFRRLRFEGKQINHRAVYVTERNHGGKTAVPSCTTAVSLECSGKAPPTAAAMSNHCYRTPQDYITSLRLLLLAYSSCEPPPPEVQVHQVGLPAPAPSPPRTAAALPTLEALAWQRSAGRQPEFVPTPLHPSSRASASSTQSSSNGSSSSWERSESRSSSRTSGSTQAQKPSTFHCSARRLGKRSKPRKRKQAATSARQPHKRSRVRETTKSTAAVPLEAQNVMEEFDDMLFGMLF